MAKKIVKTKKVVKAKTKVAVKKKPIKKIKVAPKKTVAKVKKVPAKNCDICNNKGPLAPAFSFDICLDCYLLLEPYFNNLVQEFKDEGKEAP